MSRSSALSVNVVLLFDIHDLNRALPLKVSLLVILLVSYCSLLLPITFNLPFTNLYASL